MKDYQNPNIMDDDLLEEAKALLKDMLVLIRQAKSKEIIDLYSKFASKLSAMRCTLLKNFVSPETVLQTGSLSSQDIFFRQADRAVKNIQNAIEMQDDLKRRESLILPLPEQNKAYLRQRAEQLSEFLEKLRGAKGFPEEKLKKLLDLISSFLDELEKEEQNITFLRRCASKIQTGLREIKLASLMIGGVLIAPNVLPKLDENLKAWDDIAPRLERFEKATHSYLNPSLETEGEEQKSLEAIKADLQLTFADKNP